MIPGEKITKEAFANHVRGAVLSFCQALHKLQIMQGVYLSRGYQVGGGDQLLDADIKDAHITSEQIQQLLESGWLVSRIMQLMNEQAVSGTIAGNKILDRIRSDM